VADQLAARAQAAGAQVEHVALPSPHDLDGIFDKIRRTIFRLLAKGYKNEDIAINYSSGTKVMSNGLTLAAVFSACGSLRYVRSASGLPRAKRLISTPAGAIFANRDIMQAIVLASELRFKSASRILESIQVDFLSVEQRRLREDLMTLFQAYAAYEAFQVSRFVELYQTVAFGAEALEKFRVRETSIEAIRDLAEAMTQGKPSPLICINLYNSAQRRRQGGDYNDAIAHLYRAMELMAQGRLLEKYGIDADNVDIHKAPPKYRPDFETLRSPQDGRIRLGLRKAYELLYRLENELGVDFQQDEQMPQRLDERHSTVMAHGVEPVSDQLCEAFFRWVTAFFTRHIEGFRECSRLLQFPWLSGS